ncbi:hypothetical protein MMC19_004196 [Ptychographa xylographoides]|nr:hypothetical protein [Ptychographa xylographoides]
MSDPSGQQGHDSIPSSSAWSTLTEKGSQVHLSMQTVNGGQNQWQHQHMQTNGGSGGHITASSFARREPYSPLQQWKDEKTHEGYWNEMSYHARHGQRKE